VTCEEFYDSHCSDWVDEMMQEQFWDGGVDTNKITDAFLAWAYQKNIQLTDLESFDSDKFFYNIYQCTEKGLS
jgi:hypothetical protein